MVHLDLFADIYRCERGNGVSAGRLALPDDAVPVEAEALAKWHA